MAEHVKHDRRRFLGAAATTLTAASLGMVAGVASLAQGEPRYDDLEKKLFARPVISVPTITIASDFDGPAANGAPYAKLYSGKYSHRILEGIGHNVPQEAPEAFSKAVVDVATTAS